MDPTYPLVPLMNFVSAFLTLLTFLTAQLRESWNMGVCMLSAWVFVTTLSTGIQTVIWKDNADTGIAPVFCDIGLCSYFSYIALVFGLIGRDSNTHTDWHIGRHARMHACHYSFSPSHRKLSDGGVQ